ncbi:MAG: GUN4 domain-containing protein [Pseudanabaenaceae cyanobacterium bins.39]|nr:GUN4 domain-containing protein [Pseudanabaenaceae cyanobacterium bins.39]
MDSKEILIEFVAKNGDRAQGTSIKAISTDQLKDSIHKLASLVQQLTAEVNAEVNSEYSQGLALDEVELSLKITEEGEAVLLGHGQTNGAMTLRFRRTSSQAAPLVDSRATGAKASSEVSQTSLNYNKLKSWLASAKWQEANQETWNLLCMAAHKNQGAVLSAEDIKKIDCEVLRIIDQMWRQHSQGRYGFSVQSQVYMSSILG